MRKSENYEMNLFDEEDFYTEELVNENTKKIDEVLESLENPEHDTGKQTNVEELESGESLKVALRKLAKAVADYISHKADKVAHITAEERTVWNAKLGTEKIAANLTTDTDGMVLAAAMGKNLKEQIDANANAISTLNSNCVSWNITTAGTKKELEIKGACHWLIICNSGSAVALYVVYGYSNNLNAKEVYKSYESMLTFEFNGSIVTINIVYGGSLVSVYRFKN